MLYNKPYLTIIEQLSLLEQRGLIVTDRPKAEHYLSKIGYYRLSGYSYVFRKSTVDENGRVKQIFDEFKDDVRFDDILTLYVFDKRLRLLMLDAVERIEIALRVDISLQLGKYNTTAHLSPDYLYKTFSSFDVFQEKFRKSLNSSKEDFVMHFKEKYPDCDLPIWMAVELWDFGMLSKYIENLKDLHKSPIAKKYGLNTNKTLVSWLHTINIVRNICAHHGRLWNRVMPAKPKYPKNNEATLLIPMVDNEVPSNRIFSAICIIQYLMHHISPNSSWHNRLVGLFDTFPESPHISINMMGVKNEWKKWQLWE